MKDDTKKPKEDLATKVKKLVDLVKPKDKWLEVHAKDPMKTFYNTGK